VLATQKLDGITGRGTAAATLAGVQATSATGTSAPRRPVQRIQPSRGFVPIDFRELWRHHELLYYLVWREIKARYKQTYLGASWAILRPLVLMIVFAAIFGGLAGIDSGTDAPYPLFLYAGLLPWTYFQSALTSGSSSLLNAGPLISKAYFPRLYAPLASVSAPLVDFALGSTVLFGLFAWFHRVPSWHVVFLPVFVLLALMISLGVALWLSGLAVRYRDVGFALPFVAQIWLYTTPVIYPVSLVPERFRWLLALNPMTAVVDGARWSLLGKPVPGLGVLAASAAVTAVLVLFGLFFFRRTERTIVDLI
jgi:homopolymeric O-antigen transport system permease protein